MLSSASLYVYSASSLYSQTTCEIPGLFAPSFACGDPVNYDGHDYATVEIGDQCWFQENLGTDHYNNGEAIPGDMSNAEWGIATSGAQAYYSHDAENLAVYGRLYNWYAVDDERGICPSGWHVPTDDEIKVMELQIGMPEDEIDVWGHRGLSQNIGGKLKEAGTSHWNAPNTGADNVSNFTILGSGYRNGNSGAFLNLLHAGYFWSSTQQNNSAWGRGVYSDMSTVKRGYQTNSKRIGFSVRCIQD